MNFWVCVGRYVMLSVVLTSVTISSSWATGHHDEVSSEHKNST